jgi:hypothetical protein
MILLENNLICLEREKRLIRLWAIRACRRTAATLQSELVETTTTRIGSQIIRNRFHEREFDARRPAKVPPFSPEQRRARRLFPQEHIDWNLEQLTNLDSICITLTDEFECGAQENGT